MSLSNQSLAALVRWFLLQTNHGTIITSSNNHKFPNSEKENKLCIQ